MARTRAIKQSKAPAGAGDPGNMMSLAGTPMYMAPEVIRSEKRGKLGSPDIWSMGCVLLEISTGWVSVPHPLGGANNTSIADPLDESRGAT